MTSVVRRLALIVASPILLFLHLRDAHTRRVFRKRNRH
jgi:hypothetical protein